eukprot:353713-Chlamydomonas_euryale.AAC.2
MSSASGAMSLPPRPLPATPRWPLSLRPTPGQRLAAARHAARPNRRPRCARCHGRRPHAGCPPPAQHEPARRRPTPRPGPRPPDHPDVPALASPGRRPARPQRRAPGPAQRRRGAAAGTSHMGRAHADGQASTYQAANTYQAASACQVAAGAHRVHACLHACRARAFAQCMHVCMSSAARPMAQRQRHSHGMLSQRCPARQAHLWGRHAPAPDLGTVTPNAEVVRVGPVVVLVPTIGSKPTSVEAQPIMSSLYVSQASQVPASVRPTQAH